MNLQIAPGYSAGGTLRLALRPAEETILVHEDILSWGPLVSFDSIARWLQARERYFSTVLAEGQEFPSGNLLTQPDVLRNARSITLWIGDHLNEQLFLIWLVQLLRVLGCELSRLQVIQFRRRSNAEGVVSVGSLNPTEIRAHPPAEPLASTALVQLDRAWQAVTAPDPSALLAFLEETPLSRLSQCLCSLLSYFPAGDSGLNRWERILLARTANKGPSAVRIVGYTMADSMDSSDFVGDFYLFARLRRLGDSSLSHPLVSLTGTGKELHETEVRLTEAGRAVLEGQANFLVLNAVEDWIGGVHLDSARDWIWAHHQGTLVKVQYD